MQISEKYFPNDGVTTVSADLLREVWQNYLPEQNYQTAEAERVFEKAFLRYTGQSREESELAFLRGGWTLKLQAGLARTALAGAFMAGLFHWLGIDSIGSAVLPSVLPFLFELDKVELSEKEKVVLAHLLVREAVKDKIHTPRELYQMLPEDIRQVLHEFDFLDFLEQLEMAGHLREKETGRFRVLERPGFKIIFR